MSLAAHHAERTDEDFAATQVSRTGTMFELGQNARSRD
jgi:hypothetical protein